MNLTFTNLQEFNKKWALIPLYLTALVLLIFFKFKYIQGQLFPILLHSLKFLLLSFSFVFNCLSLGNLIRKRLLNSNIWQVDLALGFGFLAFFLNVFQKFSIDVFLPLIIIFPICSIYLFESLKNIRNILKFNSSNTYFIILSFLFAVQQFMLYPENEGLLSFTRDFDSGIYHVTFPQLINFKGEYFLPDWLRVNFIPQLTHSMYIFLLRVLPNDILYLKIVNFAVILQIFIIFTYGLNDRFIGLLFFTIISYQNEFKNLIVSTNLDAVLCMFLLSQFYIFSKFFSGKSSFTNLNLLIILSSFSSGQKHFGLMFSFPIILFAISYFLFQNIKKLHLVSLFKIILQLSLTFSVVVLPFYIHNILSGNSILFPFFGSLENTYGWDLDELNYFTTNLIHDWGHRHNVIGFFYLPFDLVEYYQKYIFNFSEDRFLDYLNSYLMIGTFFLFIYSVYKRKFSMSIIAITCLIHFYSWYNGSQVIRYILPLTINNLYLQSYLSTTLSFIRSNNKTILNLSIVFLILIIHYNNYENLYYSLPIEKKDRMKLISEHYQWIQKNVIPGTVVYHINPNEMNNMLYLPEWTFLGDWFGKYKFKNVVHRKNGYLLGEWNEISNFLLRNKIMYLIIDWNSFSRERKVYPLKYSKMIPDSTLRCLNFEFYSRGIDIFSLKKKCLVNSTN